MKIVLRSFDNYSHLAIFDLDNDHLSVLEKADLKEISDSPVRGCFYYLNESLICFFRSGEGFTVKVDNSIVAIDDKDKIMLRKLDKDNNRFDIERNGEIILSKIYNRPAISPPLSAYQFFNPFSSEEDFDIFIFIQNVLSDSERKSRIYKTKSELKLDNSKSCS